MEPSLQSLVFSFVCRYEDLFTNISGILCSPSRTGKKKSSCQLDSAHGKRQRIKMPGGNR